MEKTVQGCLFGDLIEFDYEFDDDMNEDEVVQSAVECVMNNIEIYVV